MNIFDHIIPDDWQVGVSPLNAIENPNKTISCHFDLYLPHYFVCISSPQFDTGQIEDLKKWQHDYHSIRSMLSARFLEHPTSHHIAKVQEVDLKLRTTLNGIFNTIWEGNRLENITTEHREMIIAPINDVYDILTTYKKLALR
jgi:hypothetical protein